MPMGKSMRLIQLWGAVILFNIIYINVDKKIWGLKEKM